MALICDTSGVFALYDTSNVDHRDCCRGRRRTGRITRSCCAVGRDRLHAALPPVEMVGGYDELSDRFCPD